MTKKALNSKDIKSHAAAITAYEDHVTKVSELKNKKFEDLTEGDKELLFKLMAIQAGFIKR